MAKDILAKKLYILKLTASEKNNLVEFCMIMPPIIDAINFTFDHMDDVLAVFKELKAIKPYVKKWCRLEKPVRNIFDKIKNVESIEKE